MKTKRLSKTKLKKQTRSRVIAKVVSRTFVLSLNRARNHAVEAFALSTNHKTRPTKLLMKKTERRPKGTTSAKTDAPKAEVTKRRITTNPADEISLSEIKQLIELISEKQFNEFELERGSFRLRLSKGLEKASAGHSAESAVIVPPVASVPFAAPLITSASPSVTAPATSVAPEENLHILTSPIVGTFYRSPSPTAALFVNIGDSVEVGKVVCIIEAMKLMNEIQSDASGTITKIFVENGQPIEFGQPLFGIKK